MDLWRNIAIATTGYALNIGSFLENRTIKAGYAIVKNDHSPLKHIFAITA
ncbi:MAG TPA: hypothetical protein VGE40_09710 [Bacilli bacterium]